MLQLTVGEKRAAIIIASIYGLALAEYVTGIFKETLRNWLAPAATSGAAAATTVLAIKAADVVIKTARGELQILADEVAAWIESNLKEISCDAARKAYGAVCKDQSTKRSCPQVPEVGVPCSTYQANMDMFRACILARLAVRLLCDGTLIPDPKHLPEIEGQATGYLKCKATYDACVAAEKLKTKAP